MNQGKLDMAKQQLARLNDHGRFRNSELKWVGMGEFNPDDHYIYYYGKEPLRRNGVAFIVNKRVQNTILGCNLKSNRMVLVHFRGEPFKITVIQDYATNKDTEAEVDQFYGHL